MEILRQYNNDTLELISSDSYEFTSFGEIYVDSYFDLKGIWNDGVISDSSYWQSKGVTDKESFGNIHYELAGKFAGRGFPKIKLSVFSDIGSFQDFDDLQEGNDFYIRNNQIFLKPNEYLDRAGFSEGNYNLQFDFITRFKESNELYISEISPSRKEIRIEVDEKIYANGFDDDYLNQITSFLNGGDDDGTYQFNSCLELTQGRLIPINSYAVDNVTNNKRTFIGFKFTYLKFNRYSFPIKRITFPISNNKITIVIHMIFIFHFSHSSFLSSSFYLIYCYN